MKNNFKRRMVLGLVSTVTVVSLATPQAMAQGADKTTPTSSVSNTAKSVNISDSDARTAAILALVYTDQIKVDGFTPNKDAQDPAAVKQAVEFISTIKSDGWEKSHLTADDTKKVDDTSKAISDGADKLSGIVDRASSMLSFLSGKVTDISSNPVAGDAARSTTNTGELNSSIGKLSVTSANIVTGLNKIQDGKDSNTTVPRLKKNIVSSLRQGADVLTLSDDILTSTGVVSFDPTTAAGAMSLVKNSDKNSSVISQANSAGQLAGKLSNKDMAKYMVEVADALEKVYGENKATSVSGDISAQQLKALGLNENQGKALNAGLSHKDDIDLSNTDDFDSDTAGLIKDAGNVLNIVSDSVAPAATSALKIANQRDKITENDESRVTSKTVSNTLAALGEVGKNMVSGGTSSDLSGIGQTSSVGSEDAEALRDVSDDIRKTEGTNTSDASGLGKDRLSQDRLSVVGYFDMNNGNSSTTTMTGQDSNYTGGSSNTPDSNLVKEKAPYIVYEGGKYTVDSDDYSSMTEKFVQNTGQNVAAQVKSDASKVSASDGRGVWVVDVSKNGGGKDIESDINQVLESTPKSDYVVIVFSSDDKDSIKATDSIRESNPDRVAITAVGPNQSEKSSKESVRQFVQYAVINGTSTLNSNIAEGRERTKKEQEEAASRAAANESSSNSSSSDDLRSSNAAEKCKSVGWVADSTGIFLLHEDSGENGAGEADTDKNDGPMFTAFKGAGVETVNYDVYGGRSFIEGNAGTNGMDALERIGDQDCYVITMGTNDAANEATGSGVDAKTRIEKVLSKVGDKPVYWMSPVIAKKASVNGYGPEAADKFTNALKDVAKDHDNLHVIDMKANMERDAGKNGLPSNTEDWFGEDGIHYPTGAVGKWRAQQAADAISGK